MCTPHKTWVGECRSNNKTAYMSTEEPMLVPAAIDINSALSSSSYMQRNLNMTSIEDFVPPMQLPSPNTFNEQYSPWNFKSIASVNDKKHIALDKVVDIIIEDCKTPNQGWGIQHKYDTVQRGDLSQFWETDSPSSNFTSGIRLVN